MTSCITIPIFKNKKKLMPIIHYDAGTIRGRDRSIYTTTPSLTVFIVIEQSIQRVTWMIMMIYIHTYSSFSSSSSSSSRLFIDILQHQL